jgi:hypothetical protein
MKECVGLSTLVVLIQSLGDQVGMAVQTRAASQLTRKTAGIEGQEKPGAQ